LEHIMGSPTDSPAYELALRARMDRDASARAPGAIEIDAPREQVWDALAHVANWPLIRSDITDPAASGPPATGACFTWGSAAGRVSSAFALVERPSRLTWANTAPGLSMTCVYELDELAGDRTLLRCEESMNAAAVAPDIDDVVLAASIRSWIEGIKHFVESRTSR
jgi:hypothetical protein